MIENSLFASGKRAVILTDLSRDKPHMVVTVDGDYTEPETGWCKTRAYVERRVRALVDDGYTFEGEIDLNVAGQDVLDRFRISKWPGSDLRSAIQKYIRRSDVVQAVNVAFAIAGTKDGVSWLKRRLPIFCVEDVGWDWLAWVWAHKDEWNPVDLVYVLASVPKTHESGSLMNLSHYAEPLDGDLLDFQHDPLMAMRAHRTSKRFAPFEMGAQVVNEYAQETIHAAAARRSWGNWDTDDGYMLVSAAVLAWHDDVRSHPELPPPRPFAAQMPQELDWWAVDGHAVDGRNGLVRAAKHFGVEWPWLFNVMFYADSNRIDPAREDRYEEEAAAAIAGWLGFDSHAKMEEAWERKYRSTVQAEIEKQLAKR